MKEVHIIKKYIERYETVILVTIIHKILSQIIIALT